MRTSSSPKARMHARKMRSRWRKRFVNACDASRESSSSTRSSSGEQSRRRTRIRAERSNVMREPIVAQKVGNRSGIGKGGAAVGQHPAKRGAGTIGARLKSLLLYVPLALRIGVIAIIALIAFVGY